MLLSTLAPSFLVCFLHVLLIRLRTLKHHTGQPGSTTQWWACMGHLVEEAPFEKHPRVKLGRVGQARDDHSPSVSICKVQPFGHLHDCSLAGR